MLSDNIKSDLVVAMKDRDSFKTTLFRSVLAVFKNEAIEKHKIDTGLSDQEAIVCLKKEVKKRKDSVIQYTNAGRLDLAENETKEIDLIEKYLPAEITEDEIRKIVASVIAEIGEVSPSQFGVVMKAVIAKTNGNADGALVSKVVKEVIE